MRRRRLAVGTTAAPTLVHLAEAFKDFDAAAKEFNTRTRDDGPPPGVAERRRDHSNHADA